MGTGMDTSQHEPYGAYIQAFHSRPPKPHHALWPPLALAHPGIQLLSSHTILLPGSEHRPDAISQDPRHAGEIHLLSVPSVGVVLHHQHHLSDCDIMDHRTNPIGIHHALDGDCVFDHLHTLFSLQCYDGAVRARKTSCQVHEVESYEADVSGSHVHESQWLRP